MTSMKIKEVSDASGFTAATLRYYERLGLLPNVTRTAAGYRMYDPRTLDRLAFIARAKQLGCNLEEVAALTTAWDGGQCGPIQDQLRQVVAEKIAAAQTQIGELMTFTSELQHASAALERHRPDGACDAECGCIAHDDSPTDTTSQPVALASKPQIAGAPDIVCTLAAVSMNGRIRDWQALLGHVAQKERIGGGIRSVFDPSVPHDELMRLVAAEQECCQFFQFAITVDYRGVALEVRAPDDALPIVESMFGAPQ